MRLRAKLAAGEEEGEERGGKRNREEEGREERGGRRREEEGVIHLC